MRTDIFIKTCQHDAEYHRYCMESIDKFCSGFGGVTVVEGEHPKGYMDQQVQKMYADKHCPDADFILVTDSDTLFIEPVTPESFMRDGKPIWFYTPMGSVSPDGQAWAPVMREFFGVEPEFEMMRRRPFLFPTWILKELRDFCFKLHGRTLEHYIMERNRFSEWNVLGMFAWLYHRDAFSWINTDEELPPAKCRQFWSHADLSENLQEIQGILQDA